MEVAERSALDGESFSYIEGKDIADEYVCGTCEGMLQVFHQNGHVDVICPEHGSVEICGRVRKTTIAIAFQRAHLNFRPVIENLVDLLPGLVHPWIRRKEEIEWEVEYFKRRPDMAIKNLTQVPHAFLKLGQIRKGERVEEDGKIKIRDLDYFRVTFRPDEQRAAAVFRSVYGEQPRAINIRLAFPEIGQNWDAFYECYSKGGMIAKAGTDTEGTMHWLFYRDHGTNEILIRNGQAVNERGSSLLANEIDLEAPVYTYKTKDGEAPAFLEPIGRLSVVIPELAKISGTPGASDFYPGRVGYLEFRATSPHDIRNISAELAAIDYVARQAGKSISGIPLVLKRREDEISKNIKGKLSRGPSWLVHVEVLPTWGDATFKMLEQKSFPDEIIDGQVDDGDLPLSEPPEDIQTEPKPQTDRPYPPERLKAYLVDLAGKYARAEEAFLSKNTRQVVAINLDECFALAENAKERRQILTWWLYGNEHLTELKPFELLALRSWLDPKQDSGGAWSVNGISAHEARAAFLEANKAKLQKG